MDNKLNREEAKKLVSNWLSQAFQYDVEINSICLAPLLNQRSRIFSW